MKRKRQSRSPGGSDTKKARRTTVPRRGVADIHQQLEDALARENATSDILRLITSSPVDVQAVLDSIARSAARLAKADAAAVFLTENGSLRIAAHHGSIQIGGPVGEFTIPLIRGTVGGRAVLDRKTVHVPDLQNSQSDFPEGAAYARELRYRAQLAVPLLRDGVALGVLQVRRAKAVAYTDKQIGLLQVFAAQAVIAIENVRLFKELEGRNRELTATSQILQVIASSPTDVQPVFEVVLASGVRLCRASFGGVFRFDGELIHLVTSHEWPPEQLEAVHRRFPMPPGDGSLAAKAIRDRHVVQTPDYVAESRAGVLPEWVPGGEQQPRSTITIPMLREGSPLGAIVLARAEPGLFSDKHVALLQTFADQAVIAIENVRLFKELEARNAALTEALDQQTATGEILNVISRSPTNTQPVFDTIIGNAVRLSGAAWGLVTRVEAGFIHFLAQQNLDADVLERMRRTWPRPVDGQGPTCHVVQTGEIFRAVDIEAEDYGVSPDALAEFRTRGIKSMLVVPLLRDGQILGTINLTHQDVGAFSKAHVALVKTFADQAVIAIENVRLFKELEQRNAQLTEALEQQTATSDILRVISSSPTDIQPVLDAVAKNAARLCEANDAIIFRVDGDDLEATTVYGPLGIHGDGTRRPISRGWVTGRAVVDRKTIHIHDLAAESEAEFPLGRALQSLGGHRTTLATPLLRENIPLGAILIRRKEVRPFTDKQIELLQTFADQAVIAIENVRLFTELQTRNEEVTEALQRQSATAEILRVISSSPTDVQPVLNTIAETSARLCAASDAHIWRVEGEVLRVAASHGPTPIAIDVRPLERELIPGRAVLERQTINIDDLAAVVDKDYPTHKAAQIRTGARSVLAVPLVREAVGIGVIIVRRTEVRPFTPVQVALLQTFADQAVIAIENVRLFKELESRNAELNETLGQQTATSEILQVISDSAFDIQPVLKAVAEKAARLCEAIDGAVLRVKDGKLWPVAHYGPAGMPTPQQIPTGQPINREWLSGRAVVDKRTIHVPDLLASEEYPLGRHYAEQYGHRTTLAVPLLRDDDAIGVILVRRLEVRPFTNKQIELLQTFARQVVIAIENVRMFNEIQEKTIELQAANRHKDEFLASMSHELRTPLNAVIGFSEVLLERMFGEVNEKQEEYLNDILASGRHLLSLINDILDLTKIEAGRMDLDLEEFDVSVAIDNALVLVRERATRKGLSLDWTTAVKLGTIRADQRKFKQILLNLLSNALKFTPGGGRIELRALRRDGHVEIAVTDTGVGIAKEDQETVFEEFRQVGDAVQRREGTGLGLALARKFVELHGGRMWLESDLGKGSTFSFTLPATQRTGRSQ